MTDEQQKLVNDKLYTRQQTVEPIVCTQPRKSITIEEGKVIASLLKLYDAAYELHSCRRNCECQFCTALENAGNHDYRIFNSLEAKFKES